MWRLIEEHRLLDRVLAELEREFDAPRPRLETELLEWVSQLEDKGLLRRDQSA
jgi:hypothetical protein